VEPILTVEMLPAVGGDSGLRVCRARATYVDADVRKTELGAGIASDEALARDKAVSEVVERLTMSASLRTRVITRAFVFDGSGRRDPTWESIEAPAPPMTEVSAAGCHLTRDAALSSAFVEAIELEHLAEWCRRSDQGTGIVAYDIDGIDDVGEGAPYRLVTSAGHTIILSWCQARRALPAVVCLALSGEAAYFYASSASGRTAGEAIGHAMLEIAKMVIVTQAFPASAEAKAFQRDISGLPSWLRGRRPALSMKEIIERLEAPPATWPPRQAFEHRAPWLAALGRHVVSVPLPGLDSSPPAWEWFA